MLRLERGLLADMIYGDLAICKHGNLKGALLERRRYLALSAS